MESAAQVKLWLLHAETDEPEALAQLRDLLLGAGVSRVELPTIGELSKDRRSAAGEVANMVVTLNVAIGALATAVAALRGWLARRPRQTIKLVIDGDSIEFDGLSDYHRDRLIDAWLRRHGGP